MKTNHIASCLVALLLNCGLCHAIDRYVSLTGGHVSPFTTWADAATNIQAAIDAASTGDVIWVTNGIYATGGKVMAGDLTNRVALDKALTVRSVNGPSATTIQGQWDSTSKNGPGAVRCAWLTNGATLSGFTIQGGATRTSGDSVTLRSGGGVWCVSTNATVTNCVIMQDFASQYGGGAYSGRLNNCLISYNSAASGGGAAYGILNNCYLTGNSANNGGGVNSVAANNCAIFRNSANLSGGGSYSTSLQHILANCTLAENTATDTAGADGSMTVILRNCILWNNQSTSSSYENYDPPGSLTYCCTEPLPSGTGNISVDPQLLADGAHLAASSPCRGVGSSLYVIGTDIDGQSWTSPPSIGCDEWYPAPLVIVQPKSKPATGTGQVKMITAATGQEPFYFIWSKDGSALEDGPRYLGAHTASVLINGFGLNDAGSYQVVVSNAVGMATSQVAQVSVHCVDTLSTAPAPPYTNWATAATTIQNAIEAAALTDVVLVTNGVYATGGKVKTGSLTNRVALDKGILVTSLNGPAATVIQGQWDPATTNGPAAVRCAWLGDGAGLSGFALRDGATPVSTDGGGVWCSSTNAELANCVITNCRARYGGGVYKGTLSRCTVVGNAAFNGYGGGTYESFLLNCLIAHNTAKTSGGGVFAGWFYNCALTENYAGSHGGGGYAVVSLINCTVTRNSAGGLGGGLGGGTSTIPTLTNCIVYFNSATTVPNVNPAASAYLCSTPLRTGPGNISSDPQFDG